MRCLVTQGKTPSMLYHDQPECTFYTGEHTASGFMPFDFGTADLDAGISSHLIAYQGTPEDEMIWRVYSEA